MSNISDTVASKGGLITTDNMTGQAEYKRVLRAVDRGELIRLRHGVYAVPEATFGTMIDIDKIVPGGVVCMYSAWMYYQLSTQVPPAFCVAIGSKRRIKVPTVVPVNLYYWKPENLEFGIQRENISGYEVLITDIERSVCDAVKYRNKIGLDLCAEVIRSYLSRPNRNLSRLTDYARRLRVANVLNNYLEISLS